MNLVHFVTRELLSWETPMILSNDGTFGPGYNLDFDFTILFENIFFSLIPAAIALLACPAWIFYYRQAPTLGSRDALFWSKLSAILSLLIFEVARSVVWCYTQGGQSTVTAALDQTRISSSILSPSATLALGTMLYFDHTHAFRSSALISLYCTLSVALEFIRCRTFLLRSSMTAVGALSLVIGLCKATIVVMQEIPKSLQQNRAVAEKLSPDAIAGFWNRTLLLWINSTFFIGFRQNLTMENLGSLGPNFSSARLAARFEQSWETVSKDDPNALLKACYYTVFWPFSLSALPQLVVTALNFGAAFLLQGLLKFLDSENPTDRERTWLIVATFVLYFSRALATNMKSSLSNTTATRLRGIISSQILKKTLRLRSHKAADAAALTHISADVDGVLDVVRTVHDLWIGIIELAIGLYLLWTIVGMAFFAPLIPIIASTIIGWFVGKYMGPATLAWNQAIQDRISGVSAILSQITGIKMIGLEQPILNFVQGLREKEISKSKMARIIRAILIAFLPLNYWVTPLALVVGGQYWTIWRDGLEPVSVFTAFAFANFLGDPVNNLFYLWPNISALQASFSRIQTYLTQTEVEDTREVRNFAAKSPVDDLSKRPADKVVEEAQKRCISFLDVSIKSLGSDTLILKNTNISILRSTLTMVIGSVGTGKSTLLKAIIGEAEPSSGKIQVLTKSIAYCGQVAWLPNITIKQAIIGRGEFDEDRYQKVIRACALDHDVGQMEDGDKSMTGPNGSKLSGGQKQRLCLARAIYSLAPIVVCDDPLSSLDDPTTQSIFNAVFGPAGFLQEQGRTVVLATHATEWLTFAHQVISLQNSEVISYSTQDDIRNLARDIIKTNPPNKERTDPIQPTEASKKLGRITSVVQNPVSPIDSSLYRFYFQSVPTWILFLALLSVVVMTVVEKFPAMIHNGATVWLYELIIIPKVASKMHSLYITAVMRATLPFLTSTSNGALLNRFGQDMSLLAKEMPSALFRVLLICGTTVANVAMITSATTYSFVFLPFIVVILAMIQAFYLRTSRQMRLLDLESKTPLYTKIYETSVGIEHIRSFGWEDTVIQESLELLDYTQTPFYYMYSIQRWLLVVLGMTVTLTATILVSIALNWTKTTSQASLGLALLGLINFTIVCQELVLRWTILETSLGSIMRLKTFVSTTPQEKDGPDAQWRPKSWPARGAVEFRQVSATYSAGDQPIMALENVNLIIEPGEKVVVAGRTGSGKSSFLLTILNFLQLTGTVLIDGLNISKVPRQQLRRAITTIPQDPVIIPGTLRDNLIPFRPEDDKHGEMDSDDEKEADAEQVGGAQNNVSANIEAGAIAAAAIDAPLNDIAISQVLRDLGLEAYVEQHGGLDADVKLMEFSTGQKQLIAIARALLHRLQYRSQIVLMDELTSSLDYETDRRVQRAMNIAFRGCTRIVISHRSTGYENCDRILTLSNGFLTAQRKIDKETSDENDSPFDEEEKVQMKETKARMERASRAPRLDSMPTSWISAADTQPWLNETETESSTHNVTDQDRPDIVHRRKVRGSVKELRRAKQERDGILPRKSTDSSASSQRTVKTGGNRHSNVTITGGEPQTGESSQSAHRTSQPVTTAEPQTSELQQRAQQNTPQPNEPVTTAEPRASESLPSAQQSARQTSQSEVDSDEGGA